MLTIEQARQLRSGALLRTDKQIEGVPNDAPLRFQETRDGSIVVSVQLEGGHQGKTFEIPAEDAPHLYTEEDWQKVARGNS
jgi:hypothetical protein